MNKVRVTQRKEGNAWTELCKKIEKILKIDSAEFNKRKDIRELTVLIEQWGFRDFERRMALYEEGNEYWKDYGTFWKGKEVKS